MNFMRKILEMLNIEKQNREPDKIEEKENNFYWNDFWKDNSEAINFSENKEKKQKEPKPYQYILFSNGVDMSYILGSRQDFMRKDYTVDPLYCKSFQYIHKLWKLSIDLLKIIKTKKFFETLEEFDNLLYKKEEYMYGKVNIEFERKYYESKKDELLISFLDKSFTNEYRNALELKTPKGRISRIDHWFLVMDYYKQYLTPNALYVLEALEKKWTGELMPNLLEKND